MASGYSTESGSSGSKKVTHARKKRTRVAAPEEKVEESQSGRHSIASDETHSTARSALSATVRVAQRFFPAKTGKAFAEELGFNFDKLETHAKAFFHRLMLPPTEQEALNRYSEALDIFKNAILAIRDKLDIPAKNTQKLLPHHLSQTIKIIQLQNELPINCAMLLDDYLRAAIIPGDFARRFREVAHEHAQELPSLAKEHKQFHHNEPHARKLQKDTDLELGAMGLWQNNTNGLEDRHQQRDEFLRETTLFIAVLHDYIQKNERNPDALYASNEEATAEKVYAWLLEALEIPFEDTRATLEQNNIKSLLKLMCYQLIPGGTTVLLGDLMANLQEGERVESMDLIELQPIVEEVLQETGACIFPASHNEILIHEIQQAAKVMAKNDKTPGAGLIHAVNQVRAIDSEGNQSLATMPLVEKYCDGASMLHGFFEHYFKPYFPDEVLRLYYTSEDEALFGSEEAFFQAVNQQTFFTSFTPHWFMPPEFIPDSRAEQANALQDFIVLCREQYLVCQTPEAFTEFFNTAFLTYHINEIMEQVFFSPGAIAFEGKFIDSQRNPLVRRVSELRHAGFDDTLIQGLVDPSVPETDKKNLIQLNHFCEEMNTILPGSDVGLTKEIMMGAIFSEGQLLAYEAQKVFAPRDGLEKRDGRQEP